MPRRATITIAVLVAALATAAAPAAANRVACGDTITRDTTLDSDLTCQGEGLVIGADGVDLDLNGHTISGGTGTGLFAGFEGVTIRDGSIQGFDIGIYLGGDVLVRRVAVSGTSSFGIYIGGGGGSRIERSTVSANAGGGIALSDAVGALIRKNVITGNAGGIGLVESVGNDIVQNDVRANSGDGIHVGEDSDGNMIEANDASGNGDDGIEVNDGLEFPQRDNVITRNIANDNADLGIEAGAVSVFDGGGNRASGNGNPLQCVGVTCR